MIRLESVVGRHLFHCGLHGSKVIAHPLKTGKRRGPKGELGSVVNGAY
jgi:hypothetical protein